MTTHPGSRSAPTATWLPGFALLAAIWGTSFLFIHLALESFTPPQVVFGRVAVGALTLLVVARMQGLSLRVGRAAARDIAIVSLVITTAPFLLFAWAQTAITSILAGLLNGTTPLMTLMFLVALLPAERPRRGQVVGLGVGFIGIATLVGFWRVQQVTWWAVAAVLGATACYGLGTVLMRIRLAPRGLDPVVVSAVQLGCAAVTVLPFAAAPVVQDLLHGRALPSVGVVPLAAVVALGVLGSALGYVLYYRIMSNAGAAVASSVTYVMPVVSTALGVAVLGEPLEWFEVVGGLIVLGAVALIQELAWTRPRARRGDV